jgi:hypothetical protein
MSSADTKLHPKTMFSTQGIVLARLGWNILALLHFLLLNVRILCSSGIEKYRNWYVLGISIFNKAIAYLGAGVLCLRNWPSSQIVSGYSVWLAISIVMLSYFLGKIFFGYTEIVLKEEPIISLDDVFFVLIYLFLGMSIMWFKYATNWIPNYLPNYQNGEILEVLWVWSGF